MIDAPPVYLDWTFWAFVVAALALLLSQVPPVRILLRRAALAVEPYDRLNVTHYLGNPNVDLHIQLRNTGGRAVRVRALSLAVTRDDGPAMTLPGQAFARQETPASQLILTPFVLEPGQEWANFVRFFVPFSTALERESKALIKDLRADIDAKLNARTPEAKARNEIVEADVASVEPLVAFFRRNRFWLPGEYSARLVATCEPPRASVTRRFRFTLFESDVQDLDERTSRYKYGAGVYFNDAAQTEVYPRIRDLA
jgi:hypothetical protein